MKIGIPGGLLYFYYYPLWESFFGKLGAEVVTGCSTNKVVLDYGVKLCVDEACLPVKIYHGHVYNLKDKADAIFIPRIMSVHENEYICPKFCGLPEMIKNSIDGLPPIIDTTVNLRKSHKDVEQSVINAASMLTNDKQKIMSAFSEALKIQRDFERSLKSGGEFKGETSEGRQKGFSGQGRIAVIGHPYNVYDDYINMGIKKKLELRGYSTVTIEMLDENRINKYAATMPKRHFWTFGRKIVGTALSFISEKDIEGIIYLSSFGCGIDSLMEDYVERYIRRDGSIPYMKLTLDEHSGEAGFDTRVEAFLDMVEWREKREGDFSTYGGNLRSS